MAFRHHTTLLLLLVMLAAQGALAQHATVHFMVHAVSGEIGSGHDSHDPAGKPASKNGDDCSICVMAKSLSHSNLVAPSLLTVAADRAAFVPPLAQEAPEQLFRRAYHARAPPRFLS